MIHYFAMGISRPTSSLQRSLVIPAAAITLILSLCLIGIGYWVSRVIISTLSHQMMRQVTLSVEDHVELMLEAPSRLLKRVENEVVRRHVALDDPNAVAQELYGLLSDEPDVDWLFFGNEAGGIVSTGLLDDQKRIIMFTEGFKPGQLNQYSATPEGRTADLLKSIDDFDARKKDWFQRVQQTREPFWTKPYLGSIEPVLGISLSVPAIGAGGKLVGVYGIDLTLTHLSNFMARLQLGDTGRAYLVDSDGYLVASSGGVQSVTLDTSGKQQRMLPQDTPDPVVSAAGRYLREHPEMMARARQGNMESFSFDDAALGQIAAAVQQVAVGNGSPWLIVSALPASDFLGPVRGAAYLSLALVAVIVLASIAVGFWMVGRALRPLQELTAVAYAIADGAWPAVPETKRDDEIGVLARSLDTMTGKLRGLLDMLEERVSELRQSRSLLQSIIDNSSALISVKDQGGRYLLANRRYEELLHVSATDMQGKTDGEVFPRELAATLGADDERALSAGATIEVEVAVPQDDGPHRYIALKYPLTDTAGKPYAVCGIATDITERLQAEADHEARLLAEEASRAKSAFLASMSHELRTPLNAVLGYAQILKRSRGLSERQVNGLNTILHSGEHLLSLITDLLDMAKIEAGRLELYPEPVSLPRLMQGVSDIIRVRAEQKELKFHCEAAPGLPQAVVLDEKRLRQVLLNLLSNAVKFTERGAVSLRVRHRAEGEEQVRLIFEVEDSGVGIPSSQLETIFKPFEQVGAIENRAGGTGLGLSISRQLIRAMGGDIQVSSQPGVGSTFSFEVVTSTTYIQTGASPAAPRIVGYQGSRRRVLIVDDTAANRSVLEALLSELGFEISEARDGREGLTRAQETRPDLILMDLRMAGMDGLEAIQKMRQTPDLREVPIIAVSASAVDEGRTRSVAVGANAFLTKPIDQDKLLHLMGTYLSLDWLTEAREAPEAPPATSDEAAAPLVVPPPEEMDALYELALVGSMRDIRQHAAHLVELDERYRPFADKVEQLAKGYQSKALLQLVEQMMGSRPAAV
jgi:PAS domain S-box-containing protein